jgi:hypothetical protein
MPRPLWLHGHLYVSTMIMLGPHSGLIRFVGDRGVDQVRVPQREHLP